MIKVGINGFGRIGRLVFRAAQERNDVQIVAVNDPFLDIDYLVYMLQYDTVHGKFQGKAENKGGKLFINDKEVAFFAEKDPANIGWGASGADYVVESTGVFTTTEKAGAHLKGGAKKVVISAPATGEVKTVVFNVNHDILDGTETVISGASCTTNCLAPMAKVLQDKFGVVEGLMTTIHAYTGDQMTLDGPHPKGDLRRARAAAANIVPNTTGAAKAIGLVIPALNGKLDGAAQRVPVITGSLTELVTILEKTASVAEINAAMKAAATESFGYTEEELVSSDIIGIEFGSLFDATQTKVMTVGDKQLVKTVAWYDNEMSYTAQLIRTLKHFVQIAK